VARKNAGGKRLLTGDTAVAASGAVRRRAAQYRQAICEEHVMGVLWVVIGIVVLVVLFVIVLYNRLVGLRNQTNNAWAQIDVQLKRRHDLIPNLIETVKGAMSYEQETLKQVIQARNAATAAVGPAQQGVAEGVLTGALNKLFALVENYPQLKANDNVRQLQEELTATENKISFARQYYNDSVMSLNNAVQTFPSNMIANQFGFTQKQFFEVPVSETEVPKVDLKLR
jgi:LemA protein